MRISIPASPLRRLKAWCGRMLLAALLACAATGTTAAATPQIRASAQNKVPACVTPQRLMAFLKMRNRSLDPRFEGIAEWYRRHGEDWHVRWDYAFFQMAVETNFLTFRQGNGSWGDVKPRQNNFAGLGTTGGGVAGDSYPDVSTGVLAQIQHLVVYSGERVPSPVGARTKLKQDDILESMASFKGRTTFSDLARRWAADRHYGAAIEWVAGSYRSTFCNKAEPAREPEPPASLPHKLREAKSAGELPRAAALGGPGTPAAQAPQPKPQKPVLLAQAQAGDVPVRTIWSATQAGSKPAAPTTPAPAPLKLPAAAAAPKSPAPSPEQEGPSAEVRQQALLQAAAPAAVPRPEPVQQPAEPMAAVAVQKHAVPVSAAATTAEAPKLEPPAQPPAAAPTPAAPSAEELPKRATPTGPFAFAAAMDFEALTASPEPEQIAGAQRCRVLSASYGGKKTLLVLAKAGNEARYTALTVLEGFEGSMLANYLKAHAPGGASIGEFESRDAAITKARELCSGTAAAQPHKSTG